MTGADAAVVPGGVEQQYAFVDEQVEIGAAGEGARARPAVDARHLHAEKSRVAPAEAITFPGFQILRGGIRGDHKACTGF